MPRTITNRDGDSAELSDAPLVKTGPGGDFTDDWTPDTGGGIAPFITLVLTLLAFYLLGMLVGVCI